MNVNPDMAELARLVMERGATAAFEYLNKTFIGPAERAEKEASILRMKAEHGRQLINILAAPAPVPDTAETSAGEFELESPPPEFRDKVLQVAAELGAGAQVVHLNKILSTLVARGVNFPNSKPGTAVGNIMTKAKGWNRVGVGAYVLQEAKE